MDNGPSGTPSDLVAQQVRKLRHDRKLTVAELAARCAELGMPSLSTQALYKLEGQRGSATRRPRPVSVDELLVLSVALNVAPVHLLVPPLPAPHLYDEAGQVVRTVHPNDEETPYSVTPKLSVTCHRARQWVCADELLPGMDALAFFESMPAHTRPARDAMQRLAAQSNERLAAEMKRVTAEQENRDGRS